MFLSVTAWSVACISCRKTEYYGSDSEDALECAARRLDSGARCAAEPTNGAPRGGQLFVPAKINELQIKYFSFIFP